MARLLTALCVLVSAFALATPAQAARSQDLVFDAPRDLLDPNRRGASLDEIQRLGVRSLRVVLYWKNVAPSANARRRPAVDLSDPAAYSWGDYDGVVAAARERGMSVLLTLTTPGPRWAMRGRRDFLTRPSARRFGQFVEAAAKRYGDTVDTWAIGNEPNHPDFLRPQYKDGRAVSPGVYRALFRAADAALDRTGQAPDTLLIGETLPRGKRGTSVAPLTFLRGVLCLDRRFRKTRRCGRLDADGWSHHPYTTKAGPFFVPPSRDDVTIGVLSRLTRALDRAARAGAIRRRLPLWLTEFGIQSSPDRFTGVSLMRQTEFRAHAERMAHGNPRVRAFSQYLLRDDAPIEGVRAASARYGGFESGLRFANGRPKPALDGFRLPLAALRRGSRVSLWGLVRPAGGATTAEIFVRDRGSKTFRLLKTVPTDARGYLSTRTNFKRGRRYRLQWQGTPGAPVRPLSR